MHVKDRGFPTYSTGEPTGLAECTAITNVTPQNHGRVITRSYRPHSEPIRIEVSVKAVEGIKSFTIFRWSDIEELKSPLETGLQEGCSSNKANKESHRAFQGTSLK